MTNEEAIRLLEDMYIYRTRKIPARYKPTKEALKVAIEALQERKTGKWIKACDCKVLTNGSLKDTYTVCSCCGVKAFEDTTFGLILTPYCPYCGAKMEVDE